MGALQMEADAALFIWTQTPWLLGGSLVPRIKGLAPSWYLQDFGSFQKPGP